MKPETPERAARERSRALDQILLHDLILHRAIDRAIYLALTRATKELDRQNSTKPSTTKPSTTKTP